MTDGEDTESEKEKIYVTKRIIDNDIILDSFVVGEECHELKSITYASGGKCFFSKSLKDGLVLFEIESNLSASMRKKIENKNKGISIAELN